MHLAESNNDSTARAAADHNDQRHGAALFAW
jgi:hypothetical protein